MVDVVPVNCLVVGEVPQHKFHAELCEGYAPDQGCPEHAPLRPVRNLLSAHHFLHLFVASPHNEPWLVIVSGTELSSWGRKSRWALAASQEECYVASPFAKVWRARVQHLHQRDAQSQCEECAAMFLNCGSVKIPDTV